MFYTLAAPEDPDLSADVGPRRETLLVRMNPSG
jgi:hypothetical protein